MAVSGTPMASETMASVNTVGPVAAVRFLGIGCMPPVNAVELDGMEHDAGIGANCVIEAALIGG